MKLRDCVRKRGESEEAWEQRIRELVLEQVHYAEGDHVAPILDSLVQRAKRYAIIYRRLSYVQWVAWGVAVISSLYLVSIKVFGQ